MNRHEFHPLTEVCVGCAVARSTVANEKSPSECPAVYGTIENDLRYAVSVDERLSIWAGKGKDEHFLRFSRAETFGLRDAIGSSIRTLRASGRSTVAPDPEPAKPKEFGDD